jgi:hypothetical protein
MFTARPITVVAVVVAAVFVAVATAPGQPAKKTDKKADKKERVDNTVSMPYLYDDATEFLVYPLKVGYTTGDSGLKADIVFSGIDVAPQLAPSPGNELTFMLDYAGTTTGEEVKAYLYDPADAEVPKAEDTRYRIAFIKEGGRYARAFDPGPLPPGVALARKAEKPGDPIPAGWHHGHFPPEKAIVAGYQARIWVQGKFTKGPLRTEYDLPACLVWRCRDDRWYPCWSICLPEALKAEPVKPDGEKPSTVVRAVLLNYKGRVLHVMTYNY